MKKFSLIFLITCCFVNNLFSFWGKSESSFDKEFAEIFQASQFCPLDYEIFFADGAFANDSRQERLNTPSWAGLTTKVKSLGLMDSPGLYSTLSFSAGPVEPDSLSSFIVSFGLPFLVKNQTWGSLSSALKEHPTEIKEKFKDLTNLGPNASITARGFFGPSLGWLQNCELVLQLATKLPWSDAWSRAFKFYLPVGGKDESVELFNRTAMVFGINFNLIPKVLRVGGFVELLSPSMGFEQVVPTFKQIASYFSAGVVSKMSQAGQKIMDISGQPVPESKRVENQLELPKFNNAGLLSVGAQAELSLLNDKAFVGARIKKTGLNFDKKPVDPSRSGIKEFLMFFRTGQIKPARWLDFPDLGLNYSLFFNSSDWKTKRIALGLFATYRF